MKNFIDIHSHINIGFKNDCAESEFSKLSKEFIKRQYDCCKINAGAFSPYSAVLADDEIYESNEHMHNLANENKWIYQWVVLDPRQDKLFAQVERMLKSKKVLGIKIHSVCHKYDIKEYGDDIFSFANENKSFVLSHPDNLDDMSHVVAFADKYPKMKLIQAHLGSMAYIDAILSAKHKNIYTDTSGMQSFQNNIIEYAVDQIGSEKIFFGADGGYSCAFQVGRILFANITKKDKENILYKNAMREFSKLK